MVFLVGAGDFVLYNGNLVDKQWRDTNHPNAVGWSGYRTLSDIRVVPTNEVGNIASKWYRVDFGLPTTIKGAKITFDLWVSYGYTSKSSLFYQYRTSQNQNQVYMHAQNGGYYDGVNNGNMGERTITFTNGVVANNPWVEILGHNSRYGHNIQCYLRNVKVWYNT